MLNYNTRYTVRQIYILVSELNIVAKFIFFLNNEFMGMFDKAKNLYKIQKQSKAIKKDLKNLHVEAEVDGVTVVLDGELAIVSIGISDDAWKNFAEKDFGKNKLLEALQKAFEKSTKKAQEIAGAKMKGLWKELGMGA